MALKARSGIILPKMINTQNIRVSVYDKPSAVTLALDYGLSPLCSVGDRVLRYEPIARNDDGFTIHSSVSGSVTFEDENKIVIENDGCNKASQPDVEKLKSADEINFENLCLYAKKYGIYGSFSGIPLYKKLQGCYEKSERIIINCIESDPMCGSVCELIAESAKELVLGAKILMLGLGVKKCIFAFSDKNTAVSNAIKNQIGENDKFVFAPIQVRYPTGNEYILLESIYKSEFSLLVPAYEKGYPVFSAETVINVFNSFNHGLPVVHKTISVTGDCVKTLSNMKLPIGTSVFEALGFAGITEELPAQKIIGGTLNGFSADENSVIRANTNMIGAVKQTKYHIGECIKCARCTGACPMHLVPFMFHQNYIIGNYDANIKLGIFNCIECGICSYECLGKVDLLGEIREGKRFNKIEEPINPSKEPKETIETEGETNE